MDLNPEYCKEIIVVDKVDKKNYRKQYYEKNREDILLKNKEKYKCDCGIEITIHNKSRHEKSIQHTTYNNTKN